MVVKIFFFKKGRNKTKRCRNKHKDGNYFNHETDTISVELTKRAK